jgi:DNA-binding IclR family transcriptional regulator
MKNLRDLTRETVVLHILVGTQRVCLEELESLENIKYSAAKGSVSPIYTGAAGKALLSQLKENDLQLLLRNLRLDPIGPNTIKNHKILLKEVQKARRQGYATSFGERVAGSAAISVPIEKYICPVALSVLGPDNRFPLKIMMKFLAEIKISAARISDKLGNEF